MSGPDTGELTADPSYRLAHPTTQMVLRDMRIPSSDPGPGAQIPVFSLATTDGTTINNESLRRDGATDDVVPEAHVFDMSTETHLW